MLAGRRCGRNTPNLVHEAGPQGERRDQELAELLRTPKTGDVVEEVGDVRRDLLVRSEDPEVLVQPCSRSVVVTRADVCIAAKRIALAADDQSHLGVDLQIGEPVRDVDARLLELPRPLDVPQLVEAGLELDEADRLLAVLCALDEGADEDTVVARPVHGRLHRDDVRVAYCGLREDLEARAERAVGLVHEHVSTTDLAEDLRKVALRSREARRDRRDPGLELQLRPVEADELPQLGQVEGALDAIDLRFVRAQTLLEACHHLGRRGRAHLHAHDVSEASTPELALDGFEEIVRIVGDLEVRVARDPEHRALEIFTPGNSVGRKCAMICSSGRYRPRPLASKKREDPSES